MKPFAYYFPELRIFPGFHVGLITSRENFAKEMKRIGNKTAVWDERGKAFRLWIGCEDKEIAFVCFEKEQLLKMPICVGAALIAHEFLHVFDCLNKTFGINIYDHTNVYLFQMLVQDSLQEIYGAEFKHAHAAMVP